MKTAVCFSIVLCLLLSFKSKAHAQEIGAFGLPTICWESIEDKYDSVAKIRMITECLSTGLVRPVTAIQFYNNRAIEYLKLRRHEMALDDLNKALLLKKEIPGDLDIDPYNVAKSYALRSLAYKMAGDDSRSKEDASKARKLDPRVKFPKL